MKFSAEHGGDAYNKDGRLASALETIGIESFRLHTYHARLRFLNSDLRP